MEKQYEETVRKKGERTTRKRKMFIIITLRLMDKWNDEKYWQNISMS